MVLALAFPNLYQSAANPSASVQNIMLAPGLVSVINLPLSQIAFEELMNMQDLISTIDYLPDSEDSWTFIWGNANYSSKKVYDMAFTTLQVPRTFSILWKSQCTPRVKVFAWLMMVDRQNTRVMLRRRNFNVQSGVACVLCATGSEEDINHLFFPALLRCDAGKSCNLLGT